MSRLSSFRGVACAAALVASLVPGLALGAHEQTFVAISGPQPDWRPTPPLLLEVGDTEWVVRGSLAVRAPTDLPTLVVIRDLSDCRVLFSFTARDHGPGGGYVVTVGRGRTFEVAPGAGFSEGPFKLPSRGDRCPDLPDTSTSAWPWSDAVERLTWWLAQAIDGLF